MSFSLNHSKLCFPPPIYQITKDSPPFFIYHAEKDTSVEYSQVTSFVARLKMLGVPVERFDISWGPHDSLHVFFQTTCTGYRVFEKETLKANYGNSTFVIRIFSIRLHSQYVLHYSSLSPRTDPWCR